MAIELISFNLCPFVQRSVITLQEKQAAYTVTYIDLASPPDWFRAISPFGKVPVLRDGEEVVFESAVINEYVDEIHPPSLHPADPLEKAVNRAWIEFGSDLIMKQYALSTAADEDAFEGSQHQVVTALAQLEQQLAANGGKAREPGPWFNGAHYALIDAAFAPLFQRFALLEGWYPLELYDGLPHVAAWHRALLARPTTTSSVDTDFAAQWRAYIAATGGYAATVYGG